MTWQGVGFGSDAAIVAHSARTAGFPADHSGRSLRRVGDVDRYFIAQALMAPMLASDQTASPPQRTSTSVRAWSQMTADDLLRELEIGLRTILARELRIPEEELEVDRPFAELGLNSVMAMSIRREAEQLAGIELSATMLWNHPTIASLTAYLVKKLLPQQDSDGDIDVLSDSGSGG